MNIEISKTDIEDMINCMAHDDLKQMIREEVFNDEIRAAVVQALKNYMKTSEAQELIKESFYKYYIEDGDWTECDDIYDAVNENLVSLVSDMFKNLKNNQK